MRDVPDVRSAPLLLAALCVALGIVAALGLGEVRGWIVFCGAALALTLLLMLLARRLMPLTAGLWQTLALALLFVSLGGLRHALHYDLPPDHVSRLLAGPSDDAEVTLEGRIVEAPVEKNLRTRFRFEARCLVLPDTVLPTTGRVQVTLAQSAWGDTVHYPAVHRGDLVRLTGTLRLPPLRRNPADFDYRAYLRQQGVFATLSVRDSAAVFPVKRADPSLLGSARAYVSRAIERHAGSDAGRQVLTALLLGDRSLLDPEVRDRFAQTGLMHLLAVSGLHVLLVGMALFVLLRPVLLRLGVRRRVAEVSRAVVTLAILGGYAALTGGSPSVVRAVVMAAVFIGGVVLERPSSSMNSLGAAALVLLLYRPTMLFEPGFQLSFAAVAGLVLLPVPFRHLMPERRHAFRNWLASGFSASMAATLATAPILLYFFGRLPLAGLVLNFAAISVTMGAFAAALLMCVTAWWPPAASAFGGVADYLARLLVWLAELGDRHLAWLAYDGYVTNGWLLAALTLAVLTMAAWPYARLRFKVLAAAVAFAAVGVWSGIAAGTHQPRLEVVFFDVGQGDAALVTTPGGKHLLVDAGLRDGFSDSGVRTLLPHLRRFGIAHLDAVVISHPHSDHLGGLPSLLQSVSIGRVFDNGQAFSSSLFEETLFWLDTLRVPRETLRSGDTLALDPAVALHVLAPRETLLDPPSANDASVVLRLAYGRTAFLFLGDAELSSEAHLVARYDTLLRSTVVKVGHHGSITSSTTDLIARAQPERAVVSVAAGNVYRLPSDTVLARWQRAGADVHLTRDRGALWLRSDGRNVTVVPWRR